VGDIVPDGNMDKLIRDLCQCDTRLTIKQEHEITAGLNDVADWAKGKNKWKGVMNG
jgi:hypothetical protein